MTAREPSAVEVIAKVLLDEGGAPGSNLHSWRCEYPDRYGPCDCLAQMATEILAAIRAMSPQQQAEVIGERAMEATHDDDRAYTVVVTSFGLSDAANDALCNRVMDAAHELDEQVSCTGGYGEVTWGKP